MIHTRTASETFQTLLHNLQSGARFTYTRFGDGDIHLLMGKSYRNHEYSDRIRKEMEESILTDDPNYLRAAVVNFPCDPEMRNGLFSIYPDNPEMEGFLSQNLPSLEKRPLEHPYALPYYCLFHSEQFHSLMEYLRSRRKLFIGGVDPSKASQFYGPIDQYVQTPSKNAYAEIDTWWPKVQAAAEKVDLVLPTAGAASKVINKRLWAAGYPGTCLDIGSIVDWVAGINSRKWIRLLGHRINRVMPKAYQNRSFSFKVEYQVREAFYHTRNAWKDLFG